MEIEETGKTGYLKFRAYDEKGNEGFGKTELNAEIALKKEVQRIAA